MADDGLHGDVLAGDGIFGTTLPVQPNGTIIEFHVSASDGALTRNWPAPVLGDEAALTPSQNANCLYQVDDTVYSAAMPLYRIVMKAADKIELAFINSGGTGARPTLDGLNATAFPSGVMTMPVEATEHAGPIVIHRKELRPDSGGAGKQRGGLGQYMEVGPRQGFAMEFRAQLDRMKFPARGRKGGASGGPTVVQLSDGTQYPAKARFHVPEDQTVQLAFPGGGGMGDPKSRDLQAVARDVMSHRIVLGFDAVADNITPAQVVERILAMVPPPTPVWNTQQRQAAHTQHRYQPQG